MTTLSNGSQTIADDSAASIGVIPDAFPEVEINTENIDLQSGVSVDYTLKPSDANGTYRAKEHYPFHKEKSWFVLRATYNRVFLAKETLQDEDIYLPTFVEVVERNGKRIKVRKPLVNNLLFIYTTKNHLGDILKIPIVNSIVTCQYNHCRTNQYGKNPLMTVDYDDMMNFIRATSTDATDVRIVDESKVVRYKSDDIVEITGGKFVGVRGRVARLIGQQRVIVTLGFLNFATSYIPNCWLRKIE